MRNVTSAGVQSGSDCLNFMESDCILAIFYLFGTENRWPLVENGGDRFVERLMHVKT